MPVRGGLALAAAAAAMAFIALPAAAKGDRELGEHLSSQCTTCHQITGRATGGVPSIVAWPDEQFVAVMLSYKNAERENEAMRTIARRLSKEDIEALAAFFGSLPNQPAIR
jgi:cytochrome c553